MSPMTLTNHQLAAALVAACKAQNEPRGSANLKAARAKALANLKAEADRRLALGAW